MKPMNFDQTIEIAVSRFEALWDRPITPMEFNQLLELIHEHEGEQDVETWIHTCVAELDLLEETGSAFFAPHNLDVAMEWRLNR